MKAVDERFWEKVDIPDGDDDVWEDMCWTWTAGTNGRYGTFHLNRRSAGAHRVAYELCIGPISDCLELDHLCRNRRCVNPAHLEPVTHAENVRRGELRFVSAGRAVVKTHCKNGHPWVAENVGLQRSKSGSGQARFCLICRRERDRLRKRIAYHRRKQDRE